MAAIPLPMNMQPPEKSDFSNTNSLDVIKIWKTIQGEGPFAGQPAVFVRLAGCNLQCPNCFGIATKSKIPYLTRSYGGKKRLDKIKVGEKLLTFNKDMELVETTVKEVIRRTVTKWLSIKIAGQKYDVTKEHPFFTNRGLVLAKNLEIGDEILEARVEEVLSFKKKGNRNPIHDPEVMERKLENTNYRRMGRKLSRTLQKKIRKGIYIPTFNLLSSERQEEVRQKQSKAKMGEKNPNWTGLNENFLLLTKQIKDRKHIHCEKCGLCKKKLLVHHMDEDRTNDDISNLRIWCHKCHNRHHERGYNFWNGQRSDGKELVKNHNGQTVQRIKRCSGKLEVVNISCHPYNTYLANRMWVHNCDTQYTEGRNRIKNEDIIRLIQVQMPPKHMVGNNVVGSLVVITGGEPFRQQIQELVKKLFDLGYRIQIETNGTYYSERFPYHFTTIVCSPKTGKVHEQLQRHIHHLKYVVAAMKTDTNDGLPTEVLGSPIRVQRPWTDFTGTVYIQPEDEGGTGDHTINLRHAVDICQKHNYVLCLQVHKYAGVE